MFIPANTPETETEVKKSRFISKIEYIHSVEEAKEKIMQRKNEYKDARHVVWAYILGKTGDIFGYNDDHEPKGTAGRPVYTVLKGSGVVHALLTVVRYFGGTKLGTGGLARAYSDSAKAAVEMLKIKESVEEKVFTIVIKYNEYDQIKRMIKNCHAEIKTEDFQDRIEIRGTVPLENYNDLIIKLNDLTSGQIIVK